MKFERFTDGVAKIYAVANIADAGDRPVDGLKLKYRLCYQYETICGSSANFHASG